MRRFISRIGCFGSTDTTTSITIDSIAIVTLFRTLNATIATVFEVTVDITPCRTVTLFTNRLVNNAIATLLNGALAGTTVSIAEISIITLLHSLLGTVATDLYWILCFRQRAVANDERRNGKNAECTCDDADTCQLLCYGFLV
jgi:hypothetical protein